MPYDQLLVISNASYNALSPAEQILFSALQGLANAGRAGFGRKAIYCVANNFNLLDFTPLAAELWLQQLGIPQEDADPWTLLTNVSTVKEYVLYDLKANPDSANVATSLAGAWTVLPVDVSLEPRIQAMGLKRRQDVHPLNVTSMLAEYPGIFSRKLAVELNTGFAAGNGITWGPRDFAAANGAIVFFDTGERDAVMAELDPCSPIYGWGLVTDQGERDFIHDTGGAGNYYVAADAAFNLSVFSQLSGSSTAAAPAPAPAPALAPAPAAGPVPEGKYVSLIVSDGDNLQWLLNRGSYDGWWGSPVRGTLPLGWTMAPALYSLARPVWDYYAGTLAKGDELVCGPSGIGYVFDNISAAASFPQFLAQTGGFMTETGIGAVDVFGLEPYPNARYLQGFTALEAVAGVFYTSYAPWVVPVNPAVQVYDGKPVVPNTVNMSDSDGGCDAGCVASQILGDPNPYGTYAVYVNAWGNNNRPLETVQAAWQKLDGQPGIHIVSPSQLLQRALQVAQGPGQPGNAASG